MNNLAKSIISIVVILSAMMLAYGLIASAPEPVKAEPEDVATAVRFQRIQRQQVQLKVRSQGTVTPKTESPLVAEVSGRVKWLSQDLASGGYFKAGDTLLKIDDVDLRSAVARKKALRTRSLADAEHKQFEFKRLQSLVTKKLTSQSNLESALRATRIADASLVEAELSVKQAERELQRSIIKAPYDGLVRKKYIDVGQYIQKGTKVANIYSSDAVEIRIPLANKQLSYLNIPLGQRGELPEALQADVLLSTNYGGQNYQWHGKLVRTEAEIDTRTRMVNVVVRVLADPDSTQPPLPVGLFVHAQIEGRSVDNIVILPRAALRNQTQVLIIDNENRLRYREVELLRFDHDKVFIKGGLSNGDLVNLSPIQTVIDGMRVKPISTIKNS